MNTKYLLCVIVLAISTLTHSQEFAFGLRGGLNNNTIGDINSIGGSFETGHPDEIFQPQKEIGYQFGAFLDVSFGKFFLRPEINYVSLKNTYDFPDRTSNWSTSKIDIPLLIGYRVFKPIGIYAGVGLNIYDDVILDGANNVDGPSAIDYYDSTTTLNIGIQAEFKYFGIDLRYEVANKSLVEERNDFEFSAFGINQADIYDYTPNMLSLSINVFVFRTNADKVGGIFSGMFRNNKCHCPYTK